MYAPNKLISQTDTKQVSNKKIYQQTQTSGEELNLVIFVYKIIINVSVSILPHHKQL